MVDFLLRGFRKPHQILEGALGTLERQVLDALWDGSGEASVRDVHGALEGRVAYTTVMTTLDRLFRKGVLTRRKEGRAFLYSPSVSREQLHIGLAKSVIGALLGEGEDSAQPVLSCIVDAVSQKDRELLDDLERLVRRKRRKDE